MHGKDVEQDDGRKGGVKKQNSKKGFEKNEHACSGDEVLERWHKSLTIDFAVKTFSALGYDRQMNDRG